VKRFSAVTTFLTATVAAAFFAGPTARAETDKPAAVAADKPRPTTWAARPVVRKSAVLIQSLFRGRRAGMFKAINVPHEINREIKKLRASKVIAAFLKDKSISNDGKTQRIFRWLLGRRAKKKEMARIRQHLRKEQERATAFQDVIWAIINTREFLYGKP